MGNSTIETVKKSGQQESKLEDEDIYVSFGLPRLLSGKLSATMCQSIQNMEMSATGKPLADRNLRENNSSGYARYHGHYLSSAEAVADSGYNYLKYAKYSELVPEENSGPPHISVSHLSFSHDVRSKTDKALLRLPKHFQIIHDLSFELLGGDFLALLYSTELEMRTLLRVLSNDHRPQGRIRGEFLINGHRMKHSQFSDRIAHVTIEDPPCDLTVVQYLRISSLLHPPATNAFKMENMIDQLIITLALAPHRDTVCGQLGKPEIQRMKIAAQILKDTDILICDDVTKDMDIYDVAFVIDYLRDWAIKLNKIVILAIAPSTLDVLQMFAKVCILASGRFIYFGNPTNMVRYFESVNFPCPMFKNPCDYYVDLVTHDHLSANASVESLQRISLLTDCWLRKAPSFTPSKIATVSPKKPTPGTIKIARALYKRCCYEFYNSPMRIMNEPLWALFLSIIIGISFFDMTAEKRAGANDRIGFIGSILYYGIQPLIVVFIKKVHCDRSSIIYDMRSRFYSATFHMVVKQVFELPFILLTSAAYIGPAIFMTGDHISSKKGIMTIHSFFSAVTIHIFLWRLLTLTIAHAFKSKLKAFFLTAMLLTISHLSSGLAVHSKDQTWIVQMSRFMSPNYWTAHMLMQMEFSGDSIFASTLLKGTNSSELLLGCERKKILARKIKDVPIYTISQCSQMRGSQLMYFYGFDPTAIFKNHSPTLNFYVGLAVLAFWMCFAFLLLCCAMKCRHKSR